MSILRKIITYLYNRLGCKYDHFPVSVPDEHVIECMISTPQFKGDADHYVMFRQSGTFYRETLKFCPDHNLIGMLRGCHEVHFQSFEDFCKSVVKVY